MKYNQYLIQISDIPEVSNERYTIVCLKAERFSITLNGTRCFLDGHYLLCLNPEDQLIVHGGHYTAQTLHFLPYFYNVNLTHDIIGLPVYEEMIINHGYPDFHLFRIRDDEYFGILPLNEEEYNIILHRLRNVGIHINEHNTDGMWSCRARSNMISILQTAEGAHIGKQETLENEILRYIRDHLGEDITLTSLCDRFHTNRTSLSKKIKELTGLPPMQYIMEEKLTQTRPELLFTEISLEDIAEKYGFYDTNYFIRMFKKRFGIPPHQYRSAGQAERIRNESIYQQKAKDMMKIAVFEKDILKGLGRAVLFLRKEKDKTPYRASVLAFCERKVKPAPGQLTFSNGQYEAELINCFPDREAMVNKLAPPILDKIRHGEASDRIPLLIKLGFEKEARDAVEELYSEAYGDLVRYTRQTDPHSGRYPVGDQEKYPPCSLQYMTAASALGQYLKAEPTRIKQILLDIAELYRYSDSPVIPTYQNPLFRIMDGIGKEMLLAIADEVKAEHPYGAKVHPGRDHIFYEKTPTANRNITPRDILESTLGCRNYRELWISLKEASPEIIRETAEAVIAEAVRPTYDLNRLLHLTSFFDRSIDPDIKPPHFPLDPTPVIQIADQNREAAADRFSRTNGLFSFLSNIRHPSALAFFKEILPNKGEPPFLRECAIYSVWEVNYTPSNGKELERFLRTATGNDQRCAFEAVIDLLKDGAEGISDELVQYVFEMGTALMRRELTAALTDTGRMPDDLREECRFDADEKVRILAEAIHKR